MSGASPIDQVEATGLNHALGLAYRYLSRRERTVDEVERHLGGHGVSDELAGAAARELIEQGYLDDWRFARLFVEDKRTLEQWGSSRIKRGLLARGIEPELVDAALEAGAALQAGAALEADAALDAGRDAEEARETAGEFERAVELLRRRFPTPPRDRRERDRALGVLLRKGYEPELALDALAAFAQAGRR